MRLPSMLRQAESQETLYLQLVTQHAAVTAATLWLGTHLLRQCMAFRGEARRIAEVTR